MILSIRAVGLDDAIGDLGDLADRLTGGRDVMDALVDPLLELQQEWWNSAGRGTWAPDKPQTIERDRRDGQSTELMHGTDALERASTTRDAPGQRIDLQDDALTFEIELPYAGPLQDNGRSAVLDVSDRDAERLATAYLDQLIDA